jgi:hypothetical protein
MLVGVSDDPAPGPALIVPVTGYTHLESAFLPTLGNLQAAVGGYIELVVLPRHVNYTLHRKHGLAPTAVMVVNEHGLINDLPVNANASILACREIRGPAIILDSPK